ncbi:Zn-dependent exopeptidase [Pilatotrama ljubarskyi]|nr:Zn-dependent exopeptidase [Pilatotrama ljubarskyi]
MRFAKLAAPFKFAPTQVAVLTIILYAIAFGSVLIQDEPRDIPKDTLGLDVNRAFDALSKITTGPHPYISHKNDAVRNYILSRLKPLAARHDHVKISNDLTSNVTYTARGSYVVYFEGTNVLLKIDGTGPAHDGVLFSCHYDSVSSAPGATDDGIAVVTLLEMAEYLSAPERRPRRTAIFFFNNGEEDQLNGAHAFFEHPWSNLTSVFINLEGAASGGRPLVFRTTSYGPTSSLHSRLVKHPHGTVLTSEAWSTGMIRSATDYEVYARGVEGEAAGLEGFDFAFYKNRAYYHTLRDSISGMGHNGARKAIWAMLETVRGAGLTLLNDDHPGTDTTKPVYFDVLGRTLVLLPLNSLYLGNIVLLVLGPLSTIGLLVWVILTAKKRSVLAEMEAIPASHEEPRWRTVVKGLLGWERFWIALIVAILAHVGLSVGFLKLNPNIVHSHAYVVLSIFLGLSFLALVLPIQALHYILPSTFASQKLTVTLSLYFFTWTLLVMATVALSKQYGSLYWVTLFNLGAWLAAALELIRAGRRRDPGNEMGSYSFLFTSPEERQARAEGVVPGRRLVRGVRYEAPEHADENTEGHANGQPGQEESAIVETEPTEITPLIHQHRRQTEGGGEYLTVDPPENVKVVAKPADEYGWWIAQMLLLVPAVAVLLFQLEVLLLNATMHTLVDGSPPATVYFILALFSTLIFLPITPFAHKLPQSLNIVVAGILILLLAISWTVFPFSQQWPFRIYFQQFVELASPTSGLAINPTQGMQSAPVEVVRAETTITGLKGYVDRYIVPDIPSARHSDVVCDSNGLRPDLMTCTWTSDLLPSPGGTNSSLASEWLDVRPMRLNGTRAVISLRGQNTRGCRLYFDRPINFVYVHQPSDDEPLPAPAPAPSPVPFEKMHMQGGYEMPKDGVKEVRLWGRTWDKTFLVEVGWEAGGEAGDEELTGRAACEYAEYASALGGPESGRIPAYEEVKQFLPLWALPTKNADGLAEVWTKFRA